ncbi:uncharacterized protein BDW47DRAFT_122461 [Aspergillus candidus]|uniref:Uncharacterized protein n=1 Tax=Aspergillus candidus TaxID=41067 RepID=A0A2I2FN23_ASPCN|nr:hypothetical protein BDW47DRAFT_122461 [Aspergillus candidus]PLB42032.1 hypothetical protein BDW47DRAFT_122461 [Aspergillus candidus]
MGIARLEKGLLVLIQVAVQLAQRIGAAIFCTVSTAAKRALVMDDQAGSLKPGIMRVKKR